MVEKYKRNPNTTCAICKQEIYKRPSEIEANNGRVYCSKICFGISCRKEVPCLVCGKLMLSGLNKKTCSRTCSNKNRIGVRYKQNARRDKVKFYQSLKIRLLEQRGTQCERCKYSKFEILQIHHKDKNHSNNSLENLELICPNCHFEEHYLEKSWLKNKF